MTEQQAINRVLDLARSEIGYREKGSNARLDERTSNAGSGNYTKYARDLDGVNNFYNGSKNGFAWCDVFVDWLFYKCFGSTTAMKMLCQPEYSAGAGCMYSAGYYKSKGRWTTTAPKAGDQIFFSYTGGEVSHTGIVESVDSAQVITIEGNTSDQVARRTYSRGDSKIYGYGRPIWSYATSASASTSGISTGDSTTTSTNGITTQIKNGMTGDSVAELQNMLIELGYSCGPDGADGDFGNNTLLAVQEFQRANGLIVNGIVGPVMQAMLKQQIANKAVTQIEASTSTAANPKTYTVKAGDSLWGIARRELGSGLLYTKIKQLNNLESNHLTVGQVLYLP